MNQGFESLDQCSGQQESLFGTSGGLELGTGMIRWKLQQRWASSQSLLPVGQLILQEWPLQPASLPLGVVYILNREF